MKDKRQALIDLLFDTQASITERDEAAEELVAFSDEKTVSALLLKGKERDEDDLVLNSVGETLGEIWVKQNKFNENEYRKLSGITRYGVFIVLRSNKPEWVKQYQLESDKFSQ